MNAISPYLSSQQWLLQFFSSKAACEGGVIRRQMSDIERLVGLERFRDELHRRGFHAVENAGQIIVFCNQQPVQMIC